MRRSKLLATLLATTLVVASMPLNVFATASNTIPGDTNISGDGQVISGTWYQVVVPTETDFTVNPLGLDMGAGNGGTAQIVSTGYGVINKSSVPLKIEVTAGVTATGVTMAATAGDVADDAATPTMFLEVLVPKVAAEVVDSDGDGVVDPTGGIKFKGATATDFVSAGAINDDSDPSIINFKAKNSKYLFDAVNGRFALDPTDKGDPIAFKFGGKVSKLSNWDDPALAVSVGLKFHFEPMTTEAYGVPTAAGKGYGLMPSTAGIKVTPGTPTSATLTTGIDLKFTSTSTAPSKVYYNNASNVKTAFSASEYTVSGQDLILKGNCAISAAAAGLKKTVTIEYADGTETVVTVTIAK